MGGCHDCGSTILCSTFRAAKFDWRARVTTPSQASVEITICGVWVRENENKSGFFFSPRSGRITAARPTPREVETTSKLIVFDDVRNMEGKYKKHIH